MTEVEPRFKDDGSTPSHPRGCTCRPCIGRRNRRSGKKKQAAARRVLEAQTGAQTHWRGHLANEETWDFLNVRAEVKSGKLVGPAWTRFIEAEAQSLAAKAIGDPRPFVNLLMPAGTSDGLFQCRLSELARVVEALS